MEVFLGNIFEDLRDNFGNRFCFALFFLLFFFRIRKKSVVIGNFLCCKITELSILCLFGPG